MEFNGFSDISPSFGTMFEDIATSGDLTPTTRAKLLGEYMTSVDQIEQQREKINEARYNREMRNLKMQSARSALEDARRKRTENERKQVDAEAVQAAVRKITSSNMTVAEQQRELGRLLVDSDAYSNPLANNAVKAGLYSLPDAPKTKSDDSMDDYIRTFTGIEFDEDTRGRPTGTPTAETQRKILGYYMEHRPRMVAQLEKLSPEELLRKFETDRGGATSQVDISNLIDN